MKNKELKVGLFTALALVLLYYGFDFLKGKDFFESTHKYYAIYDNVDQLVKSNPVLVNGVIVGRVSNIKIMQNQDNKVLVELEIDSDIELGDSTKAILNSDFLGTKSILLSIGPVTEPLEAKDTIQAEVAKGVVDMLAATAEPLAFNLQTTIRKLNGVLDDLGSNSKTLDSIFAKLMTTPTKLNATLDNANGAIEQLAGSLKSTTDHLNVVLSDLEPTVKNLAVLSDSLKQLRLNQTLAKTQELVGRLNETIGKLSKGDNTASKLLTEDSLYVNLNNMLLSVDSLVTNFNNDPHQFLAPLGRSAKKVERARRKGK